MKGSSFDSPLGRRSEPSHADAYELLSPSMRRAVYEMGWKGLWPVQEAAIRSIILGNSDLLVTSGTGTGKTEAVFLPVISLLEATLQRELAVLHVAPLKALIDDQFVRVEELCRRVDIPVHRWHGDISAHLKRRLVSQPSGILQLTPESLESIFLNRTDSLSSMLQSLRFIVVDELHSFLGTARGVHLRSLISRAASHAVARPRIVAMSGTMGDLAAARAWVSPVAPREVAVASGGGQAKAVRYALFHHPASASGGGGGADQRLGPVASRLRGFTQDHSALIFCNTKRDVEGLARVLNSLCVEGSRGAPYLVHHGAMAAGERAEAESALKGAPARGPVSVVCTTTLELGIDVGSLDLVAQLDSTWSTASLVQRMGRSGRSEASNPTLVLVTTDDENLVQACAVVELFSAGGPEDASRVWMPFDVLFHQLLSVVEETHGISADGIVRLIASNPAFAAISKPHVEALIEYMVASDYLTYLSGPDELILGPSGESLLRSRDFYAVFEGSTGFAVVCDGRDIGEVPMGPALGWRGCRFILGGRPWEVVEANRRTRVLEVVPCSDGALPDWMGSGEILPVHHSVRTRMVEILSTECDLPFVDAVGMEALGRLRRLRLARGWVAKDRGLLYGVGRQTVRFEAFAGAAVQHTLCAMVAVVCGKRLVPGPWGCVLSDAWVCERPLEDVLAEVRQRDFTQIQLADTLRQGADLPSKFGRHLPTWARSLLHATFHFDIGLTKRFLDSVSIRVVG